MPGWWPGPRSSGISICRWRSIAATCANIVFSNDEATAATAVKEGDVLRQLIASGLTKSPTRSGAGCWKMPPSRRTLTPPTSNASRDEPASRQSWKPTCSIRLARRSDRRFQRVDRRRGQGRQRRCPALGAEGRRLSLVARLDVNKRLGRHDEAAAKAAEQQFADLATDPGATRHRDQGQLSLNATAKSRAALTGTLPGSVSQASRAWMPINRHW